MRSRANLIGGTKKPESITEEQWHASCSFHDVPDLHLEFRKEPGVSVTLADIADEVVALRAFRAA